MSDSSLQGGTRVLIALGGNAILRPRETGTSEEQMHNIRQVCHTIARLVRSGFHIAVTHGNGPQVGDILLKNEMAKGTLPLMPLDVGGAESQGMLGYMLQQSLDNELRLIGIDRKIATVLTQTLVDRSDPAFCHPDKPIGPFYTEMEAKKSLKNLDGRSSTTPAGGTGELSPRRNLWRLLKGTWSGRSMTKGSLSSLLVAEGFR